MESIGYTRKYYEHNKDLGKYTLKIRTEKQEAIITGIYITIIPYL